MRFLTIFILLFEGHLLVQGQSLKSLRRHMPRYWTTLERDSLGYLIYEPCDGGTPMIEINGPDLTIYWRLDQPTKYIITKSILAGTDSLVMQIQDGNVAKNFTLVQKADHLHRCVFKFEDFTWIIAPARYQGQFRHVSNPCPKHKVKEKQFLPVEYD